MAHGLWQNCKEKSVSTSFATPHVASDPHSWKLLQLKIPQPDCFKSRHFLVSIEYELLAALERDQRTRIKRLVAWQPPLLSIVKEPNNIRLKNRLKKIPQYWAIIFTLDQGSIFKIGIVGLGKDPLEMFQRLSELFPPLFLSNYWFITQIIENSGRDVITPPLKFPSWKLELREQAILHWHCH